MTVRASVGSDTGERMVRVTVGNVDEAPVITAGGIAVSGPASVRHAENDTSALATYTARGANPASAMWTLEGVDAGHFTLNTNSGDTTMLSFSSARNFESPADANGDNDYEVTVKATEGTHMDTHDVTVTVTDVSPEAPMFASATAARSVAENTAAGENVGAPVTATDDDAGDVLQYSLSGTDAASFAIGSSSGQITTVAALDFETKDSYSVTVTATDTENMTASIAVTITVTDVDEEVNELLQRYDADNSGEIERDEVITAINDYLFGEGDDALGRADVIEVISLYLFGQ